MACFDPKCPCSNAPKCKCTVDWDIRVVCQPSDVWNCPVRVNTAVWLIDNDEDLYRSARKRDFDGVKGWFDTEDEISFHRTVSLYCDQMIDEYQDLVDRQAERRQEDTKMFGELLRTQFGEEEGNRRIQLRNNDKVLWLLKDENDMEEKIELSLWKQKKIEAELRILYLLNE